MSDKPGSRDAYASKKGITRLITMRTKPIVIKIVGSKLCGNVFSCPKRFFVRK